MDSRRAGPAMHDIIFPGMPDVVKTETDGGRQGTDNGKKEGYLQVHSKCGHEAG